MPLTEMERRLKRRLQDVCDVLNLRRVYPVLKDYGPLVTMESSKFYITFIDNRWKVIQSNKSDRI